MGTPAARGGLSLYADLLDDADSSGLKPAAQADAKNDTQPAKPLASALRFQPTRRPQAKQLNKPKPTFPKAFTTGGTPSDHVNTTSTTATAVPPVAPPQRSTLADWAATEEDEYLYGSGGGGGQYRERGGRRKKKKKGANDAPEETNWVEVYDVGRATNVEEYLQSDERYRDAVDWKDNALYAHRKKRKSRPRSYSGSRHGGSDEEYARRPIGGKYLQPEEVKVVDQVLTRGFIDFAPPASLSFAPPPVSPAAIHDDPTGDDAYARRLALSGLAVPPPPPPSEFNQAPPPPEPIARYEPPVQEPPAAQPSVAPQAAAPYEPFTQNPTTEAQDIEMDMDESEEEYVPPPVESTPDTQETAEQPRSNRPGQVDFAARLMSKYGWTKGSGLGADQSGITSALRVKIEKRRKKPDAEGGGFAEPGGRGKIIGGAQAKKKDGPDSFGKFGKMSNIIALDNMLASITDLDAEIDSGDLKQDIGQECGEKYGTIEKISIDTAERRVFIKFTNQVSALRAVNDLEGRTFNGNSIAAKFYDADEFEKGVYR